ncbi:abortive infection system antitoxin AbiGi family protein [Yersinia enterocolitica]|uniref:abortive infection system antitoxin AbiGi family protein n=1 Tax=Yersinia TaxID=629 RepID=UPI003AB8206D
MARERITSKGGRRDFGVPMVSFCDIRLSQLEEHTQKYGMFGLRLTKGWAESKGLHPVLYISKESTLFTDYNKRIRLLKDKIIPYWNVRHSLVGIELRRFNKLKNEYAYLYNLLRYMKNYQGRLIRNDEVIDENFRFADEKEWRYVPQPFISDMWPSLNLERIKTKADKRRYNDKFSFIDFSFEYNDVKYIIVPGDSYLEIIYGLQLTKEMLTVLLSKTLTMKQINHYLMVYIYFLLRS